MLLPITLAPLQRPVSPRSLATVIVDGRPLTEAGRIRDRRVQIPMRAVFEALGAVVTYDASTKSIVARTPRKTISMRIGENFAYLPQRTYLDYPPRVVDGKVYVPLRFVSESLGSLVRWEPANRTAYVATPDRPDRPGRDGAGRDGAGRDGSGRNGSGRND